MKRSCLLGLFGLILLMVSIDSMALMPGNSLPVIRIQATELTARAIGLEIGRQSKALFPDIEQRYDTHLASLFTQTRFDGLRQHLAQLVRQVPEAYREEWQGVLDSWSIVNTSKLGDGYLSRHEYQLLNLLPDLGLPPGGIGVGVFGRVSAVGTIVGRNLDWPSSPELRALQAITVYQYEGRTLVNPGFAGITSMLNGFNQHGLFLAWFDAERYSPYRQFAPQLSQEEPSANVFILRQALETYQSVARASAYLEKQVYSVDRSLLLADRKEVQVLEYPGMGRAKVRHWYSPTQAAKPWQHRQQIAVVGCHVLAELENHCFDAKNSVRWQRLDELLDFSTAEPADVTSMSNILSDAANRHYELFNRHTTQSMLYLPANNNLYLYAAPVTGQPIEAPIYIPYPTLMPTETSASGADIDINVSWLIWLLLVTMLGAVLWVLYKH
jgi:hypothetical protein